MSDRIGNLAIAFFVTVYVASLLLLDHLGALPVEEAVTLLVVLGFGFSLLASLLTVGIKPSACRRLAPSFSASLGCERVFCRL